MITEHIFDSRADLLDQLKGDICKDLQFSIAARGKASMLLSGGSTPGPLYEMLSREPLMWDKVWLAPTDERWVAPDHQDSNEKLIRGSLIKNNAADAHYISLKSSASTPYLGQVESEKEIAELPMPFDVVLLGMGEDGHVASLFPGLVDTAKAMDKDNDQLCAAINRGGDDVARMTMTLNCLFKTKKIFLFIYGKKKLDVFNRAKLSITDELPVSYLLHQNKAPLHLFWAE